MHTGLQSCFQMATKVYVATDKYIFTRVFLFALPALELRAKKNLVAYL